MGIILNCHDWAQDIFGDCELNDQRLKKRLQKVVAQLSGAVGTSLASSCNGDAAALEGSYRLIRNERVKPETIATGGYQSTIKHCKDREILLSVEDTTTIAFGHKVKDQLGDLGGPEHSYHKGFIVHTSLMIDGKTEDTIGLIEQKRWCRDTAERGKRHKRRQRDYQEKESYKWEENSRNIAKRLGSLMPRVISVCDRESDIYEYMQYKKINHQRFIVRASWNRKLKNKDGFLFDEIAEAPLLGTYNIEISQKSGRTGRMATIELRAKEIMLSPSRHTTSQGLKPLTVNIVFAREKNCPQTKEPLEWVLLTTEDISDFTKARSITRYYELRWRIEEFHKAWKTGAGAERQRMQAAAQIENMLVILSFIAVRLLQLKESFEKEKSLGVEAKAGAIACTTLISKDEWEILWFSIEKKKKLPKKPPSLGWAYKAIAKLGGWNDTKRTGKASWSSVWKGWFKLQERKEGYTIFKKMGQKM